MPLGPMIYLPTFAFMVNVGKYIYIYILWDVSGMISDSDIHGRKAGLRSQDLKLSEEISLYEDLAPWRFLISGTPFKGTDSEFALQRNGGF